VVTPEESMRQLRVGLPRRILVLGAALGAVTAGTARAQSSREDRFLSWVHRVELESGVVPVYHTDILGFRTDVSAGRQVSLTRNGVQRFFTVIAPFQENRVVLAAGNPATKTFAIHRTDVDLQRVKSARDVGGKVASWSGRECDADFAAQVDFWIAEPVR
jgi:hypothetical protein